MENQASADDDAHEARIREIICYTELLPSDSVVNLAGKDSAGVPSETPTQCTFRESSRLVKYVGSADQIASAVGVTGDYALNAEQPPDIQFPNVDERCRKERPVVSKAEEEIPRQTLSVTVKHSVTRLFVEEKVPNDCFGASGDCTPTHSWLALADVLQSPMLKALDYQQLVPALFMGLEHVLMEAEKRKLIQFDDESAPVDDLHVESSSKFDPIEALAIFLIRNNRKSNYGYAGHHYGQEFWRVNRLIESETTRLSQLAPEAESMHNSYAVEVMSAIDMRTHGKELDDGSRCRAIDGVLRQILGSIGNWSADNEQPNTEFVDGHVLSGLLHSFFQQPGGVSSLQQRDIFESILKHGSGKNSTLPSDRAHLILWRMASAGFHDKLHAFHEHCKRLAPHYKSGRQRQVMVAELREFFGALDTFSRRYISRRKLMLILDDFYNQLDEANRTKFRSPEMWPVTDLRHLDACKYRPSIASGSTPTIYEIEDHQSLLDERIDPSISVPDSAQNDAFISSMPMAHDYVDDMRRQYPPSEASTPVPAADLPVSTEEVQKIAPQPAASLATALLVAYKNYTTLADKLSCRQQLLNAVDGSACPIVDDIMSKSQFCSTIINMLTDDTGDTELNDLVRYIRTRCQESQDERAALISQEQTLSMFDTTQRSLFDAFEALDRDGTEMIEVTKLRKAWSKVPLKSSTDDLDEALKTKSKIDSVSIRYLDRNDFAEVLYALLEAKSENISSACSVLIRTWKSRKQDKGSSIRMPRVMMRRKRIGELKQLLHSQTMDFVSFTEHSLKVLEEDFSDNAGTDPVRIRVIITEQATKDAFQIDAPQWVVTTNAVNRKCSAKDVISETASTMIQKATERKAIVFEKLTSFEETSRIAMENKVDVEECWILCVPITGPVKTLGAILLETTGAGAAKPPSKQTTRLVELVAGVLAQAAMVQGRKTQFLSALTQALPIIGKASDDIQYITAYAVEHGDVLTLRRVCDWGVPVLWSDSVITEPADPIGLHACLFQSARLSLPSQTTFMGQRLFIFPVRDPSRMAMQIICISLKEQSSVNTAPAELIQLIGYVQEVYGELFVEDVPSKSQLLDIERRMPQLKHRFVFNRLRLKGINELLAGVAASTVAEIRVANNNLDVHFVVSWSDCKEHVGMDLIMSMIHHDPTVGASEEVFKRLQKYFEEVSLMRVSEAAAAHPLLGYFYQWVMIHIGILSSMFIGFDL